MLQEVQCQRMNKRLKTKKTKILKKKVVKQEYYFLRTTLLQKGCDSKIKTKNLYETYMFSISFDTYTH